jgi:hypothetical protein
VQKETTCFSGVSLVEPWFCFFCWFWGLLLLFHLLGCVLTEAPDFEALSFGFCYRSLEEVGGCRSSVFKGTSYVQSGLGFGPFRNPSAFLIAFRSVFEGV